MDHLARTQTLPITIGQEALETHKNLFNYRFFFSHDFLSDVLSSGGIPYLTVNLHKGDMLYIPQLWWQQMMLSAGNNLFVQFLWPSELETKSYLKSSSKTKLEGNSL